MKNVLITGGAGFIGSHLVDRLLKDDCNIRVIDNLLHGNKIDNDSLKHINFVNNDIRNKDCLRKLSLGCDTIVHLAASLGVDQVISNPLESMEMEVMGTKNVVEVALENDIEKVIYASTSSVYGNRKIRKPLNENDIIDPCTTYAISKRFNEIYLRTISEKTALQTVSVRFFNIYGPKQDVRMVIPRFFQSSLLQESLIIFGDGNQTRDFTFIDDAINSLLLLLLSNNHLYGEVYNISTGVKTKISEIAFLINKLVGSNFPLKFVEPNSQRKKYEVENRYGNNEKLFNKVGFSPKISVQEGLKVCYNHYKTVF